MVIKDITGTQLVNGCFLIVENQFKTAKNGSNFLAIKIADRTGELPVKVWHAGEELFVLLEVGKVIELRNVQSKIFKDQIQLDWDSTNKNAFRLLSDGEADYSEFLPHTPGNLEEYWQYLSGIMESIQEPVYRQVLQVFFGDKKFVADFLRVPAALKRHHAYIGGLAEHTAGVTNLAAAAAAYYPLVNRDLLLTGAILHDIGKVKTYKIKNGFDGTDEGKFLGHLVLGVQMVERAFDKACLEENEANRLLRNKLLHLLVSHHGMMEWGSPIEPLLVEGCILHHADNMDAQTVKFLTLIREHRLKSEWATYDTALGRSIYVGKVNRHDDEDINFSEGA